MGPSKICEPVQVFAGEPPENPATNQEPNPDARAAVVGTEAAEQATPIATDAPGLRARRRAAGTIGTDHPRA